MKRQHLLSKPLVQQSFFTQEELWICLIRAPKIEINVAILWGLRLLIEEVWIRTSPSLYLERNYQLNDVHSKWAIKIQNLTFIKADKWKHRHQFQRLFSIWLVFTALPESLVIDKRYLQMQEAALSALVDALHIEVGVRCIVWVQSGICPLYSIQSFPFCLFHSRLSRLHTFLGSVPLTVVLLCLL